MINVIVELSKYTILTLMIVYTFHCFYMVRRQDEEEKNELLRKQLMLIFFMDFNAFLVIYLKTEDFQVILFYIEMMVLFAAIQILYRLFYKKASFLLLNNMCMLLSVGFIMLCRLDIQSATRQLIIVAAGCGISLVIPVMIRKMKFLRKLTWVYAGIGVLLLGAVFVLARTSYGAKLSLMGIQPSEAIKITFVFFMAALLAQSTNFKHVVMATVVAGLHVGILVLSRDLGSAVIFFAAYLVMIYVATKKIVYLGLGLGGGSVAAVIAYFLFGHVRERVSAWKDPMAVYEHEGYQIVQSLFAIGTGGWFGMGLCQGSPEVIPVVKNDFIFSAICEELGGIFAICLILVCMSFFLMIVNISLKIKNPFYKLIALGLGTEYAFQVLLTIGGATKFIPMTGVTLPLVSYGGSSVMSTLLMLAIIQGLYILREDEDEEIEKRRKEAAQRIRERTKIYRA
ncbi:MAG TPA: FtsW/RodA/SpoVE family cell cycle protein [Candidatus Blautia faecigallinarum]|uniref:FtsW/RodA/SpoVE family cell cycle protein n=1 Tax=Candidatus Blautia faecigallinarum TaxID=2838488 RepID=A0A9D2DV57_9FIRM|nr:FtsW/RodA/SpoVE family cell cycle protein [Candidatus Blautia faecigallinarum]